VRRLSLLALAILPLAACGNSRTPVPSLTRVAAPAGVQSLFYPHLGIVLAAPRNWAVLSERPPLVATISSGAAVVALWRYPRTAAVPRTRAELAHARRGLIDAARARDASLEVLSSKLITVSGQPAIVLNALESIAGHTRRVRSIHVFRARAELVIDEYAPPAVFGTVDSQVFSPLAHSVRLLRTR
jgi:hypothetical protein